MTFNSKDIVLVPFPFVDQNSSKKRPAIVLNIFAHTQQYNKLIGAAITSKEKNPLHDRYEHQITKTSSNGLLYEQQWVLPNKIFTIEKELVIKKIGIIDNHDFHTTMLMLLDLFPHPPNSINT